MKVFIKVYIDDVVTGAKSLTKYFLNLRSLFQLFVKHNISISSIKIFFDYSNVNLFKRRINFMRFFTVKDKFEIIKAIKYLTTLKDLKHYFDLINYLCNSVHYYVQLI